MSLAPTPWRFDRARSRVIVRDANGELLFVIEGAPKWEERAQLRRAEALRALEAAMSAAPSATRRMDVAELVASLREYGFKAALPEHRSIMLTAADTLARLAPSAFSDGGANHG